jgi:hypothetical protein
MIKLEKVCKKDNETKIREVNGIAYCPLSEDSKPYCSWMLKGMVLVPFKAKGTEGRIIYKPFYRCGIKE